MARVRVATYNIEHMNGWFRTNQIIDGKRENAQNVAGIIRELDADILGICEAANDEAEHAAFIQDLLPDSGYRVAAGKSRGAQDLVYYYRDPVTLRSVDEGFDEYSERVMDIEGDRVKEIARFERRPLEARFEVAGLPFMTILVHAKSKGVFDVADLAYYQMISAANRRRLVMQALMLRERLDVLGGAEPDLPVIVLGDMNDGPGFDAYEKAIGRSFVETVMGSVYDPDNIYTNALGWMQEENSADLWTAEFSDPIVSHPRNWKHRVWLDHVLLSPHFRKPEGALTLVRGSGEPFGAARRVYPASDHIPVYCDVEY